MFAICLAVNSPCGILIDPRPTGTKSLSLLRRSTSVDPIRHVLIYATFNAARSSPFQLCTTTCSLCCFWRLSGGRAIFRRARPTGWMCESLDRPEDSWSGRRDLNPYRAYSTANGVVTGCRSTIAASNSGPGSVRSDPKARIPITYYSLPPSRNLGSTPMLQFRVAGPCTQDRLHPCYLDRKKKGCLTCGLAFSSHACLIDVPQYLG